MYSAVETAIARRRPPGIALADRAEQVARACHEMAVRFHRGGRLIAFGTGEAAADAAHLAVEFIHPVILGKRALPAISLANDPVAMSAANGGPSGPDGDGGTGAFAAQLRLLGRPEDIAVAIVTSEPASRVHAGLAAARDLGMLTVALATSPFTVADHTLVAGADDPLVAKEIHVTTYHILWELVHVFLDRPALLEVPR
jgi:D-sedoheptulose 7-phosphate isomerase